MSDAYERHRVLRMAWNLVKNMGPDHRLVRDILSWAADNKDILRVSNTLRNLLDNRDEIPQKQIWKELKITLEKRGAIQKAKRPSVLEINLQHVGSLFELDSLEMDIISLAVAYRLNDAVESLVDSVTNFKPGNFSTTCLLLSARQIELQRRVQQHSRLISTGLLQISFGYGGFDDLFKVSDTLIKAVSSPTKGLDRLREVLVGSPAKTDLMWDDFKHFGSQRDLLLNILKNATKHLTVGMNILIYGAAGTGKTEFCKAVAAKLNMKIYSVGESDERGGEPSRFERLQSLKFIQMLLAKQSNSLILFDEMEDVFSGSFTGGSFPGSKVFTHRILEENPHPILWTCNNIESFDPSILRRMSMALEVKVPPLSAREQVWSRIISKQQVNLSSEQVRTLSQESQAPPALVSNAARATHLAEGGLNEIRLLVHGLDKILARGREPLPPKAEERPFDLSLVNADTDLELLSDRLSHAGAARFSLCIAGHPGTGKSAYARYLAERLGIPVIQKRASDLLSKWVGDAEKAIAEAFTEAREERSMLIFDEADSLLLDRRDARNSWEISQVNEMLTWMENHPMPFVCTTNLMDRLDRASLRRFTFKISFNYLTQEKSRHAFKIFFGISPNKNQFCNKLTLGDFALVRNKLYLMNSETDALSIYNMLLKESASKSTNTKNRMGFLS